MNTAETKTAFPKVAGFPGVNDAETFSLAGIEFIKFPSVNGRTPVVTRWPVFRSRFGDNNDLRSSDVLKKLQEEFLPKITDAIGEENVLTFQTDLTTLDGLKPYGVMESKISLPTFDFCREHVAIFDKYPVKDYCWTATPESAQPHDDPWWVVCVSPAGYVGNYACSYCDCFAVRPILIFDSSIFESLNE